MTEVVTVMLKECRKDSLPYKMEALRCTCRILEAHDINRFQDISDMLYPMLTKVIFAQVKLPFFFVPGLSGVVDMTTPDKFIFLVKLLTTIFWFTLCISRSFYTI